MDGACGWCCILGLGKLAVPRVLAKAGALFRGAAAAAESWELWGRLEVSWLQVWSGDVGAGEGSWDLGRCTSLAGGAVEVPSSPRGAWSCEQWGTLWLHVLVISSCYNKNTPDWVT